MTMGIRERRGRTADEVTRPRRATGLALAVLAGLAFGCAGGQVSNVGQWADVPLNKVYPYPDEAELAKRSPYVAIVEDRRGEPADAEEPGGSDAPILRRAWNQTRRTAGRFLEESGVAQVEPKEPTLESVRAQWSDAAFAASGGGGTKAEWDTDPGAEPVADYALTVRFPDRAYTIKRKAPLRLPWEDDAEYEAKRGTCLYHAEIEVAVDLIQRGRSAGPVKKWRLAHGLDDEAQDNVDKTCPDDPVFKQDLFERTLDDLLGCLRNPLQNRLAPRGFILSKRKAPEAERFLYETNLGAPNGAVSGGELAVYRASYSTAPDGSRVKSERRIADATFTDQITAQSSWITIGDSEEEILGGDVVRPRFSTGLVGTLTGPSCGSILKEE